MAKKKYTVTLDEELVEASMGLAEFYGGKLSPVINSLLKEWVEEQKKLEDADAEYSNKSKVANK